MARGDPLKCAMAVIGLMTYALEGGRAADYALVVGADECPNFKLADGGEPRRLRGPRNDADSIARLLQKQFGFRSDHITILKGPEATFANVRDEFLRLSALLQKRDQFVFHFSGHGTQLDDLAPIDESDEDEDELDEALCPFDATSDGNQLITDDTLSEWLENVHAGQIVVILDCCHSGTGIKAIGDDMMDMRYLPLANVRRKGRMRETAWNELRDQTKGRGPAIVAIFACGSDQWAVERQFPEPPKGATRMGQFTRYLVQGMTDGAADINRDGNVSVAEITQFITEQIDTEFNKKRVNKAEWQKPSFQSPRADLPLIR